VKHISSASHQHNADILKALEEQLKRLPRGFTAKNKSAIRVLTKKRLADAISQEEFDRQLRELLSPVRALVERGIAKKKEQSIASSQKFDTGIWQSTITPLSKATPIRIASLEDVLKECEDKERSC